MRANGLAFGFGPADLPEAVAGFVFAHARDLGQTERPGLR